MKNFKVTTIMLLRKSINILQTSFKYKLRVSKYFIFYKICFESSKSDRDVFEKYKIKITFLVGSFLHIMKEDFLKQASGIRGTCKYL